MQLSSVYHLLCMNFTYICLYIIVSMIILIIHSKSAYRMFTYFHSVSSIKEPIPEQHMSRTAVFNISQRKNKCANKPLQSNNL